MSTTDLLFLFVFLPVCLAVYYISRESLRIYILLAFSLVFYACGSFPYFLLLAASTVFNSLLGGLIIKFRGRKRAAGILLAFGAACDVLVLIYYKYAGFILHLLGLPENPGGGRTWSFLWGFRFSRLRQFPGWQMLQPAG